METEDGSVLEWRIENLSHWWAEAHGHCIRSPNFYFPISYIELYPKGIGGQGEHLVVRLCEVEYSFSCDLSFYASDGSLLCSKQQVNTVWEEEEDTYDLELPYGPKFEDVLSRIRESEDFIAVKLRIYNWDDYKKIVSTTVNVFKISVTINPRRIETIKSGDTQKICCISFSPDGYFDRMELITCLENDIINFMIDLPFKSEYPFAVEMCMSLTGSDDNVVNCLKNKHVFPDNSSWTFPYPLQKKEVVGKEISLFLWVKSNNLIQSPSCVNYDNRNVSVELNNNFCFSEKAPSTAPVPPDKVEVLPKDSERQTSLISGIPNDSVLVLSKELMCLYKDQDFSDITLMCDNFTFHVHKNILSARSPVFKTMISTGMANAASSEVDIGDLDPFTLSFFLTYLYTGAVEEDLPCDIALKLYYAADKYQVPSLKRDCSKFLRSNVSTSNVCDILSLADRHSDDQLTSTAHDFILDNFNVLKSYEWEYFMCREPLLAVKTLTIVSVRKQDSKLGFLRKVKFFKYFLFLVIVFSIYKYMIGITV